MQVAVLGPMVVRVDGEPVDLGTRKQRALLAALVLHHPRTVSVDALIDLLWADEAPAAAVSSVHGYVARLRRALEPRRGARAPASVLVTADTGHVYRFIANQAGTYWYHTHEASDPAVRRGLYGTLVVDPREPATVDGLDLTLPLHTLADVFVIGDRDEDTVHEVEPGTPVRLRVINTDSGPHRVALAGSPFRLAAVDGRDIHEPAEVAQTAVRIPAGGRSDLTLVMPDTTVALLLDDSEAGASVRLVPPGQAPSGPVEVTSGWPELDLTSYGTPAATPFDADSAYDRQFTMVLDRGVSLDGSPRYAHTVNGRAYPDTPMQLVAEGDLVRMTVVNRGRDTHPMHLHGHTVLALSRNGTPFTGSPIWMDTFDVQPGEVWQVAFRASNPGVWMNHCHNLAHAELGMAVHLAYDGYRSPYGGPHHGG